MTVLLTHDCVQISVYEKLEQLQLRIDVPKPNFLVWQGAETSRCTVITSQEAIWYE